MDNSLKNTLALGGSVIIASVGLFLFGKAVMNQIKRRRNENQEELLDEDNGGGNANAQEELEQEQAKKYNASSDAKLIRGYLDGANLNTYEDNIIAIFGKLTDAKLKKLADYYKKTYKISLYKQMDDEYDQCGWTLMSNCYDVPMKRLTGLGLR